MTPVIRRTWARRGSPPTLRLRTWSRDKVSGLGVLVVSPRRRRLTLYLALHPKANIRGPQVLHGLQHLGRHHQGPLVLLWDAGRPHMHRLVRQYVATHPRWHVEWFPPYAPDLNPVEQVWTYLKYGRLANFAPHTVEEIHHEVRREGHRLAQRPALLRSCFRHATLPFRV